jgi:hypothetical protein
MLRWGICGGMALSSALHVFVYAPPIYVTVIIAFPLDQVLQPVVTHSAVQYSLDLVLFLTVDESWGWGWCRSSAKDGIGMRKGQLDHGDNLNTTHPGIHQGQG